MSDPAADFPVLIAGAGPTGLVLALSLARRGVAFRIIDAASGPGEQSRAMAVQARTLEFYRQFGFAEEVVAAGIIADRAHIRRHGADGQEHEAATFRLSDIGAGISPYPYLLTYPQDDHERLLVGKLADLGVAIEWETKLTGFIQKPEEVEVTLENGGAVTTARVQWLAGCDGARSAVRQGLGIEFAGGTYEQLFYVADVKIEGEFDRDVHANLGEHSLGLMLPVRSTGMQRLIGLVPDSLNGKRDLDFADLRNEIEPLIGVKVEEVNWFSTYRVHHRVAERFRVGRAFIAGDAGHIHSPAGGQGMNTGIGDAINLGWKLADVVRGRASVAILDTYESERLPFARRLVATTDRIFAAIVAEGLKGEIVRTWLAPTVMKVATHFNTTRHMIFRTISQIAISYPDSVLSEGSAGIDAGERLPWIDERDEQRDNFAPLRSLDWQVHVYGEPEAGLSDVCLRVEVPLHIWPWREEMHDVGLHKDATYLIRPDGYVALASSSDSGRKVASYVQRHGLNLGSSATANPVF